jgi:hypothetical protein
MPGRVGEEVEDVVACGMALQDEGCIVDAARSERGDPCLAVHEFVWG